MTKVARKPGRGMGGVGRRFTLRRSGYERVNRILDALHRPAPPTLIEWAERHVVIPSGPHAGKQFRCEYQPFFGLFYRELQRRTWPRVFVTGCAQSGKTLLVGSIPLLHAVFACHETAIYGIPDLNMAQDKFSEDILPVVQSSGYSRRLPTKGEGSRGGNVRNAIRFANAGKIKLMSYTGSDARRSGFTARKVVATEVDKGDQPTGVSEETDPIGQLEARLGAFGWKGQFLGESTPSNSRGRIWREKARGTDSRIACPCPHCGEYVTPEREHLVGWRDAPDILAAMREAAFVCPACGVLLTEEQRVAMNRAAVLLHKGQTVLNSGATESKSDDKQRADGAIAEVSRDSGSACGLHRANKGDPQCRDMLGVSNGEGSGSGGGVEREESEIHSNKGEMQWRVGDCGASNVIGEDPPTDTFFFRWNAFNNLLWDTAYIAAKEWRAMHDPDAGEDNSEKYLRQFVWALPYDPPEMDLTALEWKAIAGRAVRIPRGTVPDGTVTLTAGIDLGKRMGCHWTVIATSQSASPHVVDYGCQEVEFAEVGLERALMMALSQLWDLFNQGWANQTGGQRRRPDVVVVDSGWQSDTVYAFIRSLQAGCGRWLPSKGFGWARQGRAYQSPKKLSSTVVLIGEHCHVAALEAPGVLLAEFDSDHWKSYTHARAKTAAGEPGALTLFDSQPRDHENYARQLTAEREVKKYDSKRGLMVSQWEPVMRRANHYLDATSGALVAAYLAGVRMFAPPPPPPRQSRSVHPDGEERPWIATNRK